MSISSVVLGLLASAVRAPVKSRREVELEEQLAALFQANLSNERIIANLRMELALTQAGMPPGSQQVQDAGHQMLITQVDFGPRNQFTPGRYQALCNCTPGRALMFAGGADAAPDAEVA